MIRDALVVLAPFAVLFGGILWLRASVLVSAIAAAIIAATVGFSAWGMTLPAGGAAFVKACFVTADILLILLGALFFLSALGETGALGIVKHTLSAVSPDRRIQGIVIGLFFTGFIEGLAGFGTPAMLAAPLLVAVGFPLRAAILLPLFGNTIAVPFGAAGTPFAIGLTQGLAGFANGAIPPDTLSGTILYIVMIGFPLAVLAPLFMSCLLTHASGGTWRDGLAVWRHALAAGVCFAVPYVLVALTLGPEFPSLLASLFGGIAFVGLLRLRPLGIAKPWEFPRKESPRALQLVRMPARHVPAWYAAVPYAVVVLLLFLSRLPALPLQRVLRGALALRIGDVRGVAVDHALEPLYSPGFFLILGACIALLLFGASAQSSWRAAASAGRKILRPGLTLFALILLVQILLYSGENILDKPSMPIFAALLVSHVPLPWALLAPFVGLFGSLTTGSVTVSNLLFASFQAQTATLSGSFLPHILALQVLGAAAGNMLALHNIVAVLTTVDGKGEERNVLALLAKPALVYVALVAGMGVGVAVAV